MKFTLFFLTFVLSVAFFAYAGKDCIDIVRVELEWGPVKELCKSEVTETEHLKRVTLIIKCMVQKKGLLSEDFILDYPKFKEISLDYVVNQKDEIETFIQDCWDNKGTDDQAMRNFFLCYTENYLELCPDVKKWLETF